MEPRKPKIVRLPLSSLKALGKLKSAAPEAEPVKPLTPVELEALELKLARGEPQQPEARALLAALVASIRHARESVSVYKHALAAAAHAAGGTLHVHGADLLAAEGAGLAVATKPSLASGGKCSDLVFTVKPRLIVPDA